MTTRHQLVLLVDALITLENSEDWELKATQKLKEKMQLIIADLDSVWFEYRQLTK